MTDTRTVLDALREWRYWWENEYAADLTLTGKQADELCRLLKIEAPSGVER